ncbi:MAG: glycosyltransferase [Planctomycetota bacterium]
MLTLYLIVVGGLAVYGINCYVLRWFCVRALPAQLARSRAIVQAYRDRAEDGDSGRETLPVVTVQLPVFNERYVVGRLIQAVAQLDWPHDKLDIQVLDDSTDDTRDIARQLVEHHAARGLPIRLLQRDHRDGYKAGALQAGLATARGEFVAIFDADFMPEPDFLWRTVPLLMADERVAMVQARWGHVNDGHSLLTRMQAVAIDGHFGIEQGGRLWSGALMNFNGTCGVWRIAAIADAGGWQHDTLTEDLDLSYRAQLAGWRMEYAPDVEVPGEIPSSMAAFRSQQRRWAKGSIQTMRKLWRRVLLARQPLYVKAQALLHISHYLIHPLMLLMAALAWPMLRVWDETPVARDVFVVMIIVALTSTFGPSAMYLAGQRALRRQWLRRMMMLPVLIVVGMGIAVSNSRAVLEAMLGIRSGFVRTPKDNGAARASRYRLPMDWTLLAELALTVWCACSLVAYLRAGRALFAPYLLAFTLGFATMSLAGMRDLLRRWRQRGVKAAEPAVDIDVVSRSVAEWQAAHAGWRPADSVLMTMPSSSRVPAHEPPIGGDNTVPQPVATAPQQMMGLFPSERNKSRDRQGADVPV